MSEDEIIYIDDDNNIEEPEGASSESTGSSFGSLEDNNSVSYNQLNQSLSNNQFGRKQNNNSSNPLSNIAKNALNNKLGNKGNVPESLKKRKNNIPGTKANNNNTEKNNSEKQEENNKSEQTTGLGQSNQNANGKEKGTVEQAADAVAKKGGSAAMQAAGVPKPLADFIANKFLSGKSIKFAIIGGIVAFFMQLIIILGIMYIMLFPILKGLEIIGDLKDGASNFFTSAGNWISGDGWCADDAECTEYAENKFYEKVEDVSNQYPNVDMSLVLSSVLYGINTTENFEDATDITDEDVNEIESNSSLSEEAKKELYQDAKSRIKKVAKNLNKGKEAYEEYMLNTFIPKHYDNYITDSNTKEQILKDIYALASFFESYMKKHGIGYLYTSTICPEGINVNAGSDSNRYPSATNLSLEEYVAGSLASEYNVESEPEVMKAVAIAIRSFFVAHINSGGDCTVDNTTNFQTYREPTETTIKIAQETAGKVLIYNEKVIGLHYSIFPGNNADGWSNNTVCENSVCTNGTCTAMLYKDPNNEKAYFSIPQSYGGYNDVSSISNSHCHGMSTLIASYYANNHSYSYNDIINLFVSQGVGVNTLAMGEQSLPVEIPTGPENWRDYTSRVYQYDKQYVGGAWNGNYSFHFGIDFTNFPGGSSGKPVYAIAPATVIDAGWNYQGYGNYVQLGHDVDGDGAYDLISIYAHMLKTPLVFTNDIVVAGQQLGEIGTTGNSTGPHLHFEIRRPGGGRTEAEYNIIKPHDIMDRIARGEPWYEK